MKIPYLSGSSGECRLSVFFLLATFLAGGSMMISVTPAGAQTSDSVCDGVDCDNLPTSICDPGGFQVSVEFTPANESDSGTATYTYEICSPPAGVCSGDGTSSCLSNEDCTRGGNPPGGICNRECAVDTFRGLSHFSVFFPELGGLESCLTAESFVGGTCECKEGTSDNCFVDPNIVLGDGSCFANDTPVAKCDNTNLDPGDCILMTLNIAGETTGLGLGATVVVSKESTDCNESCLAGPSCEACDDGTEGDQCLTRTLGFWGTHPWITNDFVPVTVCGEQLTCDGLSDGKSNPSCEALECNSVMEGLGSRPAELGSNQPYVAMVKQLTAAQLNLKATAALLDGAACGDWVDTIKGQPISYWIEYCEGLCDSNKQTITASGCIEALDEFNKSQDVLDGVTPAPFDRPPVDDFGAISGADPTNFQLAQGLQGNPKIVIGKGICE